MHGCNGHVSAVYANTLSHIMGLFTGRINTPCNLTANWEGRRGES